VIELAGVAETFKEDESLVRAALSDGVLNQLHNQSQIEMDSTELLFIVGINATHQVEGF